MFNLRFLVLFLFAAGLSTLISCGGAQNSPNASTSSSPSPVAASSEMTHQATSQQKININNAILSQLDKLEAKLGIAALSNKIQASRPYGKPEELVSKNVVTQAQFDQIRDLVTIEDIKLTGEAKDIDYMVKLGLMKGHLIVAKELLDLKKPEQAEPHIGHPVEEIYADVEDQLDERQVKEFKTPLITLQDLVKAGAKDTAAVDSEFKTSVQAVEGAIAVLPTAQRNDPKFVLSVIDGLLDTANSEYTASIANGKITQAIEYQDSRGFVNYANSLFQKISPSVQKKSPETHQAIATALADLIKTWPASVPPSTPVKTPDAVSKLIKAIETSNQKVIRAS
jgi:Helix-hairpin-helix motif